jgi:hypothetical protein
MLEADIAWGSSHAVPGSQCNCLVCEEQCQGKWFCLDVENDGLTSGRQRLMEDACC